MIYQNVFLATLALASTASNFGLVSAVRGERKYLRSNDQPLEQEQDERSLLFKRGRMGKNKKDKDKKNNKKPGSSVNLNPQFQIIANPPTAAPAKTTTDLEDWKKACQGTPINNIDLCTLPMITADATPENCMKCLFAFGSLSTSTAQGSASSCRNNEACGTRCSTDLLKPFFECGKRVDKAYVDAGRPAVWDASTLNTSQLAEDAPGAQEPQEPQEPQGQGPASEVVIDTVNCPATLPESGTNCTFVGDANIKSCPYYEYNPVPICTCVRGEDTWVCTNQGSGTLDVEKEDLTTIVTVTNPLAPPLAPVADVGIGVDLSVNNLAINPNFCGAEAPMSGDACNPSGFEEFTCCYDHDTFGTVECTCSGSTNTFSCAGGSLSSCP